MKGQGVHTDRLDPRYALLVVPARPLATGWGVAKGRQHDGLWLSGRTGLAGSGRRHLGIINIVQNRVSSDTKLLWVVLVLVLPVIGLILWYLLGPRER